MLHFHISKSAYGINFDILFSTFCRVGCMESLSDGSSSNKSLRSAVLKGL